MFRGWKIREQARSYGEGEGEGVGDGLGRREGGSHLRSVVGLVGIEFALDDGADAVDDQVLLGARVAIHGSSRCFLADRHTPADLGRAGQIPVGRQDGC